MLANFIFLVGNGKKNVQLFKAGGIRSAYFGFTIIIYVNVAETTRIFANNLLFKTNAVLKLETQIEVMAYGFRSCYTCGSSCEIILSEEIRELRAAGFLDLFSNNGLTFMNMSLEN